jgi:uncharacterized protein YjeT (DUF2065 family)
MRYFLSVLGLVLIIEGIPYFAAPDKMKQLMLKLPLIPSTSLRLFGLTAVITGLLLIYLST